MQASVRGGRSARDLCATRALSALEREPAWRVGRYIQTPPPADVGEVLDAVWTHIEPVATSTEGATVHRVVADASLSLCVIGTPTSLGRLESRIVVLGPVRTPRIFRPCPGQVMVAVRFKLEWCRSLLGAAPEEHVDAATNFGLVHARRAAQLRERVVRCTSAVDIANELVGFLRHDCDDTSRKCPPARVCRALDLMRANEGRTRLSGLASHVGMSERHLRRSVRGESGISPARFRSIQRFHAVLQQADAMDSPDWARLAAAHGYSDQSHLIAEAHAFGGASPRALHGERRAEPAGEPGRL